MATNPHIYVSSVHGTNTGASDTSFASQQTGAMTGLTAASVYDNVGSAVAGASPSDGDTIYVADDHNASYDNGASYTLNSSGTESGAGLKIVSVDASEIANYKPGAQDTLSDISDDILYKVNGQVAGVSLSTGDDSFDTGTDNTVWKIQDVTLKSSGASDRAIVLDRDGGEVTLTNVDVDCGSIASTPFLIQGGSFLIWNGGALTGSEPSVLFSTLGQNSGAHIEFNGVDLSLFSGTLMPSLVTLSDDVTVTLNQCRLHASVTLHGTLNESHQRFSMFNCDDSTGNSFHRFYVADGNGAVKNNDSTYVTATETWYEGSDKSSIEVTTTANCSHIKPFIFELPAQYVDLGDTAKDTLTIDLVTDQTLTDTDIAAFLCYPDGTTMVQANWVTSGKTVGTGNYGIDPLAAGTTLTTSALGAGDWTGEPVSPNFYEMVLDTSGDPGEATAVSIRIEVYTPSIAAGELFIHPLITVSAT